MTSYSYQYGTYNQSNGSDQPGAFTVGSGDFLRTTITNGTLSNPEGIDDKTTITQTIENRLGVLFLKEVLVKTTTGSERISWQV
ncbi:MAG: hypothetical protein K8S13_02755, partial [Desulfobacula sp.]|uniref:hypothetical protein n=1 Tax=Desulfobacula sp. TaxID=2593537 RepID=UPI0025C0215A